MAKGDHIRVKRKGYWHHGIDAGGGWVYHYSGTLWKKRNATVRCDRRPTFADGGSIEVVHYDSCDPVEDVIDRARSRLEEQDYDLLRDNCEHFARWCKTGLKESRQVENVIKATEVAGDITGNAKVQTVHDALVGARAESKNATERGANVAKSVAGGRLLQMVRRLLPPMP